MVLNGAQQVSGSGLEISGDGNRVEALVINGFLGFGVAITRTLDGSSSDNIVKRNYIGVDARGTWPVPNQEGGMTVGGFGSPDVQASRNLIQGNIIAANKKRGIVLCDAADTQIFNNRIGVGNGNVPMGNEGNGIELRCAGDPRTSVINNRIAYNLGDGVIDVPDYRFGVSITAGGHQGLLILHNAIFANTGLGINLLPAPFGTVDTVTPNDPGDSDPLLQNYPILTAVTNRGPISTITGTLNSTPNGRFVIELFANHSADPTGHGEGQFYLATAVVRTDAAGNAMFSVNVAAAKIRHTFLTATARNSNKDTSEFSQALQVP